MQTVDDNKANIANDISNLAPGARAILTGRDRHPGNGQHCTILRALPNPSHRPENQWLDVRFDDYRMGRFLLRYLKPAAPESQGYAA
jgi:hypothetical protein